MPDIALGLATAGQLRRAGFVILPDQTGDDATDGFEIACNHADPPSAAEHEKAKKRGNAFPKTK